MRAPSTAALCVLASLCIDQAYADEAKQNLQVSVDAVKELLVACKGIDGTLA